MKIVLFILIFFTFLSTKAQEGFIMDESKKIVKVPFQLLSNLIFVDVNVNGVNLTFLLDTGVAQTVLFTLDDTQTVIFDAVEKLPLKGMGSQAPIDALIARNNKLILPHYSDLNHDILIVLNQEVNFSPNVGIPVNGILGYDFFRNYPVEIDYQSKRIIIRKPSAKKTKMLRKYQKFPLKIINEKPYIDVLVKSGKSETLAKVLVDNGNSDALWLFANRTNIIEIPSKNIPDFLGRGFSGNIYGKKGRIEYMKLGKYEFKNIITSFPDSVSTQNINNTIDRLGSIGGEVLRRFYQIFDYKNNALYLKPNKNFEQEFLYDKSGLELQHEGMEWVEERIEVRGHYKGEVFDGTGEKITNSFAYKFDLKPIYKIFNVRTSSSAEAAGLKVNDQLISINGKIAYKMSLDQITKLLRGPEDKIIKLEVLRDGKAIPIRFRLRTML
jgi:hypothetical protein